MIRALLGRTAPSRETLVLCYHALSERWRAPLAVTPAHFRRQLEWLVERGYRGATFHDAITARPAGRTLVVTFDDAFLSVLEHAQPVLSSLGLPATVFVVTDLADAGRPLHWRGSAVMTGESDNGELRGMNWQQLRELADSGWEIGSHTRTHPRLTQLSDEGLASELRESREACQRALGTPCRSLAYPFGDFDSRVLTAAANAGYTAAASEDLGPATPLAWPRVGIYRNNSMRAFRLKVSPTVRRVRSLLRGGRRGRPRRVRAGKQGPH